MAKKEFEEVFLLDGLRLVVQKNPLGHWYLYLVHDKRNTKMPVVTLSDATTKGEIMAQMDRAEIILQSYEFPRATDKSVEQLIKYLRLNF